MNSKTLPLIYSFMAVLPMLSCATMATEAVQEISFNSDPTGAEVLINGIPVGTTPLLTIVSRYDYADVIVSKEGYVEQEFTLKTTLEPWFLGNLLLGGSVGSSIDITTGASARFEPDSYFTTLEPKGLSAADETQFLEDRYLRNYALSFFYEVGRNLSTKGHGEHLKGLLALVDGVDVSELHELYFARENNGPVAFAELLLQRRNTTRSAGTPSGKLISIPTFRARRPKTEMR